MKIQEILEGWGAEPAAARHGEQMAAVARVLQKYKSDPVKSKIANYLYVNNWSAPAIEKELASPDVQQKFQANMAKYEKEVGPIKNWTDKMAQDYLSTEEAVVDEEPASRDLCLSGKPDSALGASQLASCKSQGYRARDGGKSHKVGSDRIKVRGKKIKGHKYGGPLPDWG